jgi:hypothetical protein
MTGSGSPSSSFTGDLRKKGRKKREKKETEKENEEKEEKKKKKEIVPIVRERYAIWLGATAHVHIRTHIHITYT